MQGIFLLCESGKYVNSILKVFNICHILLGNSICYVGLKQKW
jgi:hypothetical protein